MKPEILALGRLRIISSRQTRDAEQVQDLPQLHTKTLPQKTKQQQKMFAK
jgi:hypothetical protein